jgi:hypothetical protein
VDPGAGGLDGSLRGIGQDVRKYEAVRADNQR